MSIEVSLAQIADSANLAVEQRALVSLQLERGKRQRVCFASLGSVGLGSRHIMSTTIAHTHMMELDQMGLDAAALDILGVAKGALVLDTLVLPPHVPVKVFFSFERLHADLAIVLLVAFQVNFSLMTV